MTPRLEALLALVRRMPGATCTEIAAKRGISRHRTCTALRELRDKERVIASVGHKSGMRWCSIEQLERYLATPVAKARAEQAEKWHAGRERRLPRTGKQRLTVARPVRKKHIPPAPMSVFNLSRLKTS